MIGLYFIYYSVGRIWVEAIRIDPSEIFLGLRINIWSAIVGIIVGLAIMIISYRRHTGFELSAYLEGREPKGNNVPAAESEDKVVSEQ
jgi:prolipoprotein diacylglyceryltransferase